MSNLPSYLGEGNRDKTPKLFEAYRRSILQLAEQIKRQGARLVRVSPLPSLDQTQLTFPLGLCHSEWIRPNWAIPQTCLGVSESCLAELQRTEAIRILQTELERQLPVMATI